VSGTVNPSGTATTYHFEYGTTSGLGSKTPSLDAGSGNAIVSVTANLTGLKPGATYYYRLVATNSIGTVDGADASFVTPASARPATTTSAAANVLTTTATLGGSIDPNGSETTYYFEYGKTASYGSRTAAAKLDATATATTVSVAVSGLKPDTAYLFRLVAANAAGTTMGIGQVLKTSQSACDGDTTTITTDGQVVATQKTAVKTAEDNLAQVQANITESITPSSATVAQDEAAVKQDEATVATDQQAVAETTLKAPIAGTVTAVNGSVGTAVTGTGSSVSHGAQASSSSTGAGAAGGAGATSSTTSSSSSGFVTIASLDNLEIVAGFAEADATRIAVGQPATITFPALPNVQVAGKVTAVSSTSTVVSNVVTYPVTIVLVNPPSTVKEGMTANVSVVDETRTNVLELPTAAITTTGATSTVELEQNGTTTATRVTTGIVGNSTTEIVSGLKKNDVVVLPTVTVATATAGTSTGATGAGLAGLGGLAGGGGATAGGGAFAGRGAAGG
jgi:multidrug efflux pump subunit AcrA (membrane-fusion protein)